MNNIPRLMPYQDLPFNGDYVICEEFRILKANFNINVAIETGSCMYSTTAWLATIFDKVYTVEINPEYSKHGKHKLEPFTNVKTYIKDSVNCINDDVLTDLKSTDVCIFFLDAHWNNICPLLGELYVISKIKTIQAPIITIHDFYTGSTELGYDTYNGKPYNYEFIKPSIETLEKSLNVKYSHYYNKEALGAKRGIIYLIPKKNGDV